MCRTASRCSGLRPEVDPWIVGIWRRRVGEIRSIASACPTIPRPYEPYEPLFYRDALREIPRLIDVAAAAHRDVIREQLQRQGHRDRREHRRRARQRDDRVMRRIQHAFQRVVRLRW